MNQTMQSAHLVKNFEINNDFISHKPFEISQVFDDETRTYIEIKLSEGEVLKKHKANVPISIFCLSGSGLFKSGENLEEEVILQPGTLLTLDEQIFHEIVALPKISLLLTKFKIYQ